MMVSPPVRTTRFHVIAIALSAVTAAWLVIANSASAAERFYLTGGTGVFGSTTNWAATQGGASGASVPGGSDTANFTSTSTYTVLFGANATSNLLDIEDGVVTFDLLGRTYTVTGGGGAVIGNVATDTGRLIIRSGSMAVDTAGDDLVLGSVGNSTGYLTITTGGRWLGSPDVVVGLSGTGNLDVNSGGDLTSSASVIGSAAGVNGTASISGIGSTWVNQNLMFVGDTGNGTLSITSGATVSTADAVIADDASSVGAVFVSGAGAAWSASATLSVGDAGFGSLHINNGGVVNAGPSAFGSTAGGEGFVTIDGAGSQYNSGGILDIGYFGAGTLGITNGGTLTVANATIGGAGASGVGHVTVSGEDSSFNTTTGNLLVGTVGTGTLNVESGGVVSVAGTLNIGDPGGAQIGTVNLRGGSITAGGLTRTGTLNWTDGTITVRGGNLNNGGVNLTINGGDANDLPTLVMTAGALGQNFAATTLNVGSTRQGALTLADGAQLSVADAQFGALGGSGVVTLAGGALIASGNINLAGTSAAAGGTAVMNLLHGGSATTVGTLRLWPGATIHLDGGSLNVGTFNAQGGRVNFNSGAVNFTGDAALTGTLLDVLVGTPHDMGAGRRIASPGTITLSSSLNVDGGVITSNIFILSGAPVLTIDAGSVTANNGVTNPVGGRIVVGNGTLAAGAALVNNGELQLSQSGATISGAGLINAGLVFGGGRINADLDNLAAGQIRVGAGERLVVSGAIHGNNGLVDVNGGTIEFTGAVTNNSANPSTGSIAGRNATLRFRGGLTNSGSLTFTSGESEVFGDIQNVASLPTTGRIVVSGGGTVTFYDDIVNSGTIQVSAAGGLQSTAVFFGSLSGNGASGAGHVFLEGDARPGFSPGVMSFGGDLSFGSLASLNIELGGTAAGTQYDRVAVAGEASLGGTVSVKLINGFIPQPGQQFTIMTFSERTGEFDTLAATQGGGLPGLRWDITYLPTSVILTSTALAGDINLDGTVNRIDAALFAKNFGRATGSIWTTGDFNGDGAATLADLMILQAHFGESLPSLSGAAPSPNAVPEPSAWLLGTLGVAAMGLARRCARQKK